MASPTIVWGTGLLGMTIQESHDLADVLRALKQNGIGHIDTAARYPSLQPGESERMLGREHVSDSGFTVDTKILASSVDGSGELSTSAIAQSLNDSLKRLATDQVNTVYCHRYDPKTPLAETAAAMSEFHKQGLFKQWGVSRFAPAQLEELLKICEEGNFVKPAVYQGEYNILTRTMETQILPILHAHNMSYYAHRPFASGFLTGNVTKSQPEGTRFAQDFPLHQVFRKEYGDERLHDAVKELELILKPHGISCHEASLRWVVFHSVLGSQDGVIFGGSKVKQIEDNAASIKKGPLPDDVANSMNELWPKYAQDIRQTLL